MFTVQANHVNLPKSFVKTSVKSKVYGLNTPHCSVGIEQIKRVSAKEANALNLNKLNILEHFKTLIYTISTEKSLFCHKPTC